MIAVNKRNRSYQLHHFKYCMLDRLLDKLGAAMSDELEMPTIELDPITSMRIMLISEYHDE